MPAAKSVTITARVPTALARKLEAYAKAAKRTRSWVIEDILDRYVDNEMAIVEAVNEGLRQIDAGLGIPHEEVFRKLREKSAARRKAMAKKAA
ncbi:MAG TPA: ribbon-helix-helix protein, CopG family [Rhizomicrobium sp.]|jgi:predicted transcriptional regulator|nr:ribbon-helix-helix protein, CopG family [Rhizomicrobium sp.]